MNRADIHRKVPRRRVSTLPLRAALFGDAFDDAPVQPRAVKHPVAFVRRTVIRWDVDGRGAGARVRSAGKHAQLLHGVVRPASADELRVVEEDAIADLDAPGCVFPVADRAKVDIA